MLPTISVFVTPDNFLEQTVMAFGICHAPATSQGLMQRVSSAGAEAHLDEVVVYATDWQSRVETPSTVFHCLQGASLTRNIATPPL